MALFKFITFALASLAMSFPAVAADTAITGTVTYRERMALPTDAVLHVTLVELPAGHAVAGAAAVVPAKGQVPLAFNLAVRAKLDARTAYGLIAEITGSGRSLFRTPQPVPVIPASGQPVDIVVHFAPAPLPTSSAPPPVVPATLVDMVWRMTSIGGRPATGASPPTLSISSDHRANGTGGCNSYVTSVEFDGNDLAFEPAAATRMACATPIMEQEMAYFTALSAVASYEVDGKSLRLLDAAGVPLIGLVRAGE